MEKQAEDEKNGFAEQQDASHEHPNVKPTVHYNDTNGRGPAPDYLGGPSRANSFPFQHSRQSSYAETDDGEDEDEDYDWSGEEDLVDEEAKFESQMGIKQKSTSWGPKRSVALLHFILLQHLRTLPPSHRFAPVVNARPSAPRIPLSV